ncbi:uncharacterized protein LOC134401908 [Elgaria multicarinata webbii]|uniref:uncharacterized protein LOC134401908 n=1 Tax=Elgaria multicarinata webbii TaxID=159646 RepID=UPI002FCD08D3
MLSANLRRQLLMDGRYGSLAFVCTKTDSFNITDLVRDLQLQDEIQAIEDELAELENQKMQAEVEKRSLYEQLQQEQQRRGSEAADPAWLRRQHEVLEKEFRISALQREKDAKLRAISLICVQARNKFSKRQIAMDFSAGLEAMMREAAYPDYEEDDDEDLEDGEFASSESRNPRESQDRKLQVFTVSSTEYLKLCGKLLRDGQPQVFHDVKDTEIPALKKFAIDTALKHSMVATQKVIRDLARVLSQMVNYLTSQRAEDNSHRAQVQKIIQRSLQDLPGLLQEAIDGSLRDIQGYFDGLILASLRKGTAKAKELSEAIVRSWGSPVYGGCVYPTYRAACNRHGVYTSTSSNTPCVDFNSNLAEPIYKALSMPWHEVFSSKLIVSLDGFAKAVLARLKSFFRDLKRKLSQDRRLEEAIRAIGGQQMEAAGARLLNFTLDLNFNIELKHRMISRVLTPAIQARMEPAYTACTQMSGPGCFRRMKERMEAFIHNEKDTVFDAAAEKLQEELDLLQQYIRASFQSLVQELNKSLKMQFEPMLMSVQRNAKIIPELMDICAKVDKLCKRSCVDYVLPNPAQTEDSAPRVEQQLQRSPEPTSFSAAFMDIRLGAVALPHIQQPKHSAGSPELPPRASAPPPLHGAIAVLQPPQFPPLSLRPYGQKRAAEAVEPQLQKKCKGPAPGAGCDPAGSALLWGTSGAKSELRAQGFAASRPLATASRAPALEDGKQKALGLPGAPLHCVDMKPDIEHALPGSAGVLRVRAKEGIWGKCSNLNAEEEEEEGKMEIGRETRPADCSWMSH